MVTTVALVKPLVKMAFRKLPNYITKGRASYVLQRGVPKDCRAKVGKNKWTEPGGKTKDRRGDDWLECCCSG